MRKIFTCVAALCALEAAADAAAPKIDFGLFVDSYYAFDLNRPSSRERSFTTLPTRHNEFAINLIYLEGRVTADRLRGRVALQSGTSVSANYASEYRDPTKSGSQLADVLQSVQEAYAGYRIADGLWIDAGILFSHIGFEGFISRDNWTYTRSLIADFSPYYQTGVRLSYEVSPKWSAQLHVLNGWQNLVETNNDKAIGTQIAFKPTADLTITHNSFVGREAALRIFQDLIMKYRITEAWETALAFDVGFQEKSRWHGASFQNRVRLNEVTHVGLRAEYYADPDGVVVPTGTPKNFQTVGASINLDRQLTPQLLWRTEVRALRSQDAIFPAHAAPSKDTVVGTTSFALSL